MRIPAKTAALLVGLGVGVAVGPSLASAAIWAGLVIAVLGVALLLFGETAPHRAGDTTADRDGNGAMAGDGKPTGSTASAPRRRKRPALSGLGPRVEQILELAEEQADDHRAEARLQSEAIVTAARREAEAILNRAHEQVAGITGTRWDLAPVTRIGMPPVNEKRAHHRRESAPLARTCGEAVHVMERSRPAARRGRRVCCVDSDVEADCLPGARWTVTAEDSSPRVRCHRACRSQQRGF